MKAVDALDALKTFVAAHPNQQTAAKALGISAAYLSDILNERRNVSDRVLEKLGLKRIVVKA